MSLWRDEKYLRLLSPQLDRFSQKHAHTFNFRCPLCGDSERTQSKARGYVFAKQATLMFKCHNCSVALPFSALLKRMSRHLYHEYLLEALEDDKQKPAQTTSPEPPPTAPCVVHPPFELSPLSDLSTAQNALYGVYEFAMKRHIRGAALERLYATNTARTWVLPLVGEDKAQKVKDGPAYLVQPLKLPDGTWYGAQLRDISRKDYLTFRWSHDPLKMFGLDSMFGAPVYVLEGPIDSLFIPNAIAACGAALLEAVRIAEDLTFLRHDVERVYVWDNEPRNKEVTRQIGTAIKLGESVVIWPRGYPKDINDMVRVGMKPSEVYGLMHQRTFSGLNAELEFAQWKR